MTKVIEAKDCLKKIGLLLFPCIRQTFSLYQVNFTLSPSLDCHSLQNRPSLFEMHTSTGHIWLVRSLETTAVRKVLLKHQGLLSRLVRVTFVRAFLWLLMFKVCSIEFSQQMRSGYNSPLLTFVKLHSTYSIWDDGLAQSLILITRIHIFQFWKYWTVLNVTLVTRLEFPMN